MKKLFFLLFLVFNVSYSQVPQKMSHRGTAFNTNGQILSNIQINVRVKIFEGNISGNLLFEEIHNSLQTNQNGQYSIEIGNGEQQGSNAFSSIDWGTSNQKWLEIGIALSTSANTFVTGSSQLMSVPYALYAQKTDPLASGAPIVSVNSLNDLRSSDFHTKDILTVYVKYHTFSKDGGGGFFNWVSDTPDTNDYADDDGVIINPISNSGNAGRWIRRMEGYIDVRYYGCQGHSQDTDEEKIQKAIDYAARNASNNFYTKGNVVFLHNGSYKCKKLILRKGVTLKGESKEYTGIFCLNDEDSNPYLIEIESGVVDNVAIEDMNFISLGSDASDIKGCFNFKATLGTQAAGGLWNSRLKNLRVLYFTGTSLNFEGGTAYNLLNQFITLENVEVEGAAHLRNANINISEIPPVLRIAGLNGQFIFTNCKIDGGKYLFENTQPTYTVSGINVYIGSITADYNNVNDRLFVPSVITFQTSTIQTGEIGFYIQSGNNIHINNCWFENFESAIIVKGNTCEGEAFFEGCMKSKSINIVGNNFGYSAGRFGYLNGAGTVIAVENAQVNIANNYVIDPNPTEDTYFVSTNGKDVLGINLENNYFETPKLGKTYGVLQERSVTSITTGSSTVNGLKTQYNKLIFVKNPTESSVENVYRIDSNIAANEEISIRAERGSLIFHAFNSVTGTLGYNLYLGEKPMLTINQGQIARFIKIDNIVGGEYGTLQLISVSNAEDTNWIIITNFNIPVANFNTASPVRCRKKIGIVYLDGILKGGTTQTNGVAYKLITLPQGCRPLRKTSFTITRAGNTSGSTPTSTVVGRVDIDIDGSVYGVNYSNIWSNLSGISFVVD